MALARAGMEEAAALVSARIEAGNSDVSISQDHALLQLLKGKRITRIQECIRTALLCRGIYDPDRISTLVSMVDYEVKKLSVRERVQKHRKSLSRKFGCETSPRVSYCVYIVSVAHHSHACCVGCMRAPIYRTELQEDAEEQKEEGGKGCKGNREGQEEGEGKGERGDEGTVAPPSGKEQVVADAKDTFECIE